MPNNQENLKKILIVPVEDGFAVKLCNTYCWSCRSVYRRQDVCVAKVILWILSSCTYWWENRYPPILGWWPPIVGWWPPHTWLMTPPYLTDGPPILGWWPPILDWWPPPILGWCPPIVGWWPPYPYLPDAPPPWLDDVLSQVGFSSVCVKAGPHETCAAGTSFHLFTVTTILLHNSPWMHPQQVRSIFMKYHKVGLQCLHRETLTCTISALHYGVTGWPWHRENNEFGSYFFQTGKTQGIWFWHREKIANTGKIFGLWLLT